MKTNSRRTIIGVAAIFISSIAFSGAVAATTGGSTGSTVSTTAPATVSTTSTTAPTGDNPVKALLEAYHAQIKAYVTQQRADLISKIQALNIPDARKSNIVNRLQERWHREDEHMAKMMEEREQHRENRAMNKHTGTSSTGTSTTGTSTTGTNTSGTTTTTQGL